jgi:cytochrome c1
VQLDDGSDVVADERYLTTAVRDPWAEKVAGFSTVMPRNALSDAEVAAVVAYIKELAPRPGS